MQNQATAADVAAHYVARLDARELEHDGAQRAVVDRLSELADTLAEKCACAIDRVQALRKARGEAPLDLRRGLRDRRRSYGGGRKPGTGAGQKSACMKFGTPTTEVITSGQLISQMLSTASTAHLDSAMRGTRGAKLMSAMRR